MHSAPLKGLLLALFVTVSSVGCGDSEGLSGHAFPIENGVASAAFPAAGALVYNREKVVCTASLVASDRILSAGHCFMDATADKIQKLEFVIGYDWKTAVVRAPVDHVLTHPGFDRSSWPYAHDIAVGVLAKPIESVKPAMLHIGDAEVLTGKSATLVGFGKSASSEDIGLRRQTTVTIADVLEFDWRYEYEGTGACNGDSGGPAYARIEGVWRQVGVTSGGEGDGCRVNGLYTRIDIHAAWLEQQGVPVQTIRDVICSEASDGRCDGLCEIDADCEELMCGEQCPPIQSAPPADGNGMSGGDPSQQQQMPGGMMGMMMQMMQMFQQVCPMCAPSGGSQPSGGGTPSQPSTPSCPTDWHYDANSGQCLPPCPSGWSRDAQGSCQPNAAPSNCPWGWVEDDYGHCQPECRYVTRDVIGDQCIYNDQFSGNECYRYPVYCDSVSCRCPW